MVEGYLDFEFDLPGHLIKSLIDKFDNVITAAPLTTEGLAKVPEKQGLYLLLYRGEVVYVGKTDSRRGLAVRLSRHAKTIQHRLNINPGDMSYKAMRVFVFTAMDLETPLIEYYRNENSWNNKGFGSNDPGHNRDKTRKRRSEDGFDDRFPIDVDYPIEIPDLRGSPIYECLKGLSSIIPYFVRYQKQSENDTGNIPHPDLYNIASNLPVGMTTAKEFVRSVMSHAPAGWQSFALPGRIIVYKDNDVYPGIKLFPY